MAGGGNLQARIRSVRNRYSKGRHVSNKRPGKSVSVGDGRTRRYAIAEQSVERIGLDLLVLQPSPFCNINCDYCYLPDRAATSRMSHGTLRQIVDRVAESGLLTHPFELLWHAGEPLAVPMKWYEEAIGVISDNAAFRRWVSYNLQTNGLLLNQAWCDFLKRHRMDIGISIDGPEHIHDFHRKTRSGEGTFQKALAGLKLLQQNRINFGVITVISRVSLDHPDEIYQFYREQEVTGVGFNIEEMEGAHDNSSLELENSDSAKRIREFLERIYELNKSDGFPLRIREFEQARSDVLALESNRDDQGNYFNSEVQPLRMINVDWQGNFSSFSPELLGQATERYGSFSFGNLTRDAVFSATGRENFQRILADIEAGNRNCAEECEFWDYCGGASPSNKYYENGTFESSFTRHCQSMVQFPLEIVLNDLEAEAPAARN